MIEIDGSYGEGGGQILRMSIALSALTGKPIKVFNIRANRPNPGLRRQHMTAIEAVAKICNAKIKGLQVGSSKIEFYPNKIKGGNYKLDVGTAGSITLVLQACLLPSLFAENETYLRIKGGTDVKWAPPWDYFKNVFVPLIRKMGIEIEAKLIRRGYYPVGNGEVEVKIKPCQKLRKIEFIEKIDRIEGIINISNLPIEIAERIKKAAENEIKHVENKVKYSNIRIEKFKADCPGVGIVLWTREKILGADCLGEKGKPAEMVGREAGGKLIKEINANVDLDEKAVDQLLPYMAIANEKCYFVCKHLSKHASTEMWLIKKFIDVDFEIKENKVYEIKVIPKL